MLKDGTEDEIVNRNFETDGVAVEPEAPSTEEEPQSSKIEKIVDDFFQEVEFETQSKL